MDNAGSADGSEQVSTENGCYWEAGAMTQEASEIMLSFGNNNNIDDYHNGVIDRRNGGRSPALDRLDVWTGTGVSGLENEANDSFMNPNPRRVTVSPQKQHHLPSSPLLEIQQQHPSAAAPSGKNRPPI